MRLPATQPVNDPAGLWSLQLELLAMAESLLGPREASKKIYQPQFTDDGPQLRNTRALDGAYVELSRNGQRYWPTVVFEMSHETVHLLNPIPGNTNNLEEGVAVAFSLHVQSSYGISIPVSMPSYLYALRLVQALPEGPLGAAARVRRQVGSPVPLRRNVWWNCFPRLTEVSWPVWQEDLSDAPADEPWRLGLAGRIPARRDLRNGDWADQNRCR